MCPARAKRAKSPTSAHSPMALRRVDAAQAAQPRDGLDPRRIRDQLVDRRLQRVAAHQQRVDRADVVGQRDLRAALAEIDGRPATGDARVVHAPAVPSKRTSWRSSSLPDRWRARIRSPRTSSRARTRSRSASSVERRDPDRVQPADHQQPHQPLGVAAVGLDPIRSRAARSCPAPRPHTRTPSGLQRPREPEPGRARLIGHPHRPRQTRRRTRTTSAVAPGRPPHRAARPTRESIVAATTFAACTSSPAQLRTCAMSAPP